MIVMESMGERLGTAGLNTLVCIGVVFVVLIFISFVISLFRFIPKAEAAIAAKPPITTTRLAFLMSTQWLVIAPRPNVGARLATVGPCQTRAWLSTASIPSARENFCVK